MELFFPLLFLLGFVLLGWGANFYLIYHLIISIRDKVTVSYWVLALAIGWILNIVGVYTEVKAPFEGRLALFCLMGVCVWICGFFMFRKSWKKAVSVDPSQGVEETEGSWPPPPTPPAA